MDSMGVAPMPPATSTTWGYLVYHESRGRSGGWGGGGAEWGRSQHPAPELFRRDQRLASTGDMGCEEGTRKEFAALHIMPTLAANTPVTYWSRFRAREPPYGPSTRMSEGGLPAATASYSLWLQVPARGRHDAAGPDVLWKRYY